MHKQLQTLCTGEVTGTHLSPQHGLKEFDLVFPLDAAYYVVENDILFSRNLHRYSVLMNSDFSVIVVPTILCQECAFWTAKIHVFAESPALLKLLPHLFAQLDDSEVCWGSVSCCPSGCATKLSNFHYCCGVCSVHICELLLRFVWI